jgi:hypothetical protein
MFVRSIERDEVVEALKPKFESYVTAEENRLLRNLEQINYRIDGPDTFRVISGEGRIEMVNKAVGDTLFRAILTRNHV